MVMRQMRASAKWIMLVVVIAFVGWMVFDVGMGISGQSSGGASDTALRINGVRIDYQSFLVAVRNAQESQRAQTGSAPITLEDQRELEDRVVEDMVMQVVLEQEFKRRGIEVSDAEIRAAARTSPPPEVMSIPEFQTDGQFDLNKYQRYLAAGADPQFLLSLEQRYRTEIPRVKLYEQLASSVYVPDTRLWRIYQDQHDSAQIEVVTVRSRSAFQDNDIEITESEMREYYREHRDEFTRPDAAYLSYLAISRQLDSSDSTATRDLAFELHERITSGEIDFETVARTESADSASRVNNGDLGEVRWGRFHPDFEGAVRDLNPGEVSEPVETPFGYHIIRLDSTTDSTYYADHVLVGYELRGDHLEQVENTADTLDLFGAEQEDPEALDQIAQRLGLEVHEAPLLLEGDRMRIEGERIPDVSVWAFEARPGESSLVIEAPQHYYLFRLDSLQESRVIPFEEVRDDVREQLGLRKKAELARQLAGEMRQELTEGESIAELAPQVPGVSVDTLGPLTRVEPGLEIANIPEAIGAAFGEPVGSYSDPIVAWNYNVYLIRPIRRRGADTTAFLQQVEEQRERVTASARDARIRQYLAALREDANVIDRRREIEELQRELADNQGFVPGIPSGF